MDSAPAGSESITVSEAFNCERDCGVHRDGGNVALRSARACGLPGLPPVKPAPTSAALHWPKKGTAYQGRYPDLRLAGSVYLGLPVHAERPLEDPADGCPGAWYRTAFIDSLYPYMRRRIEGGGRVPNYRLDQCDDWLIHDAIQYLEDEEERFLGDLQRIRLKRQKEAAEKRASTNSSRGRRL